MQPKRPVFGDAAAVDPVEVTLREVDANNWRDVATLRVPEEQRDFTMGETGEFEGFAQDEPVARLALDR